MNFLKWVNKVIKWTILQASQLEILFKVSSPRASSYAGSVQQQNGLYQEPISRAEIIFRNYWRRGWIILLWLMICATLFAWKFIQYSHRTAFQVMGYCLCTAKGAAETLKLNMAIILLPVCRNSITWLRRNRRINSVIPFNDNINFHKVMQLVKCPSAEFLACVDIKFFPFSGIADCRRDCGGCDFTWGNTSGLWFPKNQWLWPLNFPANYSGKIWVPSAFIHADFGHNRGCNRTCHGCTDEHCIFTGNKMASPAVAFATKIC